MRRCAKILNKNSQLRRNLQGFLKAYFGKTGVFQPFNFPPANFK